MLKVEIIVDERGGSGLGKIVQKGKIQFFQTGLRPFLKKSSWFWEQMNNPNFKGIEFDAFKNESGANSFTLTPQKKQPSKPISPNPKLPFLKKNTTLAKTEQKHKLVDL